jgi:hypothetical protein
LLPGSFCRAGPKAQRFKLLLKLFSALAPEDTDNMKRARKLHGLAYFRRPFMSISSVSQPLAAQQASAAAAVSGVPAGAFQPETATPSPTASAGTSLSGGASLSDQTLQALLGLTQNDPAGQASAQAVHRHHHHHGGGAAQPPAASNAASNSAAGIAGPDSSAGGDDSDSLATALGA